MFSQNCLKTISAFANHLTTHSFATSPLSVKLHLRDGQTDERTDTGNRIWCILA